MAKLLMISGHGAAHLGKHGAFYNTLGELHKHWERIDIICPRGGGEAHYFDNVFVHPSPWPLIFQPWWILRKGTLIMRDHHTDIMTVHDYPPFYNGLGARWLLGRIKIPTMSEIMHVPGYPRAGSMKEIVYKHLMAWFVASMTRMAKIVRVINHDVGRFLERAGVPTGKIRLISAMYIDTNIFKPLNVEKKYDLIFVGRLEENKGIMLFLDAVKLSGLRAIIVGTGPLKETIKEKVATEKINVVLHGWAKDSVEVASLMNESRLLVMPSYNEGGPRVILEAMACGVPVLATPVGIVPDVVHNMESGMIIDWNSQDISTRATKLLADREVYEACRSQGMAIARQHERTQAIAQYAEALKSLIRNHG
jgi:glycosyltransferase involved in cell wall biosynthesis